MVIISLIIVMGSISVHLFDREFAGLMTRQSYSNEKKIGEKLYNEKGCQACHGKDGSEPSDDSYPKISNQNMTYLIKQLTDIRDGRRSNGGSSLMQSSMGKLSDDEIEKISIYLKNN